MEQEGARCSPETRGLTHTHMEKDTSSCYDPAAFHFHVRTFRERVPPQDVRGFGARTGPRPSPIGDTMCGSSFAEPVPKNSSTAGIMIPSYYPIFIQPIIRLGCVEKGMFQCRSWCMYKSKFRFQPRFFVPFNHHHHHLLPNHRTRTPFFRIARSPVPALDDPGLNEELGTPVQGDSTSCFFYLFWETHHSNVYFWWFQRFDWHWPSPRCLRQVRTDRSQGRYVPTLIVRSFIVGGVG